MEATLQPRIHERLNNGAEPTKATKAKRNALERRIDALVDLEKRYKAASGAGDRKALIAIAGEYLLLGKFGGCPTRSNEIIAEAEGL